MKKRILSALVVGFWAVHAFCAQPRMVRLVSVGIKGAPESIRLGEKREEVHAEIQEGTGLSEDFQRAWAVIKESKGVLGRRLKVPMNSDENYELIKEGLQSNPDTPLYLAFGRGRDTRGIEIVHDVCGIPVCRE